MKLGKQSLVYGKLGAAGELLIDKAQKNAVTTEITLEEFLPAPVSQGQRLGTVTVKAGEQILAEVPLVAAESVERLRWGDLMVQVLKRIAMAA